MNSSSTERRGRLWWIHTLAGQGLWIQKGFCGFQWGPVWSPRGPEDSRGSYCLGALKGIREVQQLLTVLLVSLIVSVGHFYQEAFCICSQTEIYIFHHQYLWWMSFQLVCVCKWWNYLTAHSSNSGRVTNYTPSFEMMCRTKQRKHNKENIIEADFDALTLMNMWPSMSVMAWQMPSVPEIVPVVQKHLPRLWWVSCSARIVMTEEITEQESLLTEKKLTYILHCTAFSCF